MSTATEILADLEELWEGAEPAPFKWDDTLIIRRHTGEYGIRPRAGYDSEGENFSHIRVLERAKPKAPEWEAVVASNIHDEEHARDVFIRTKDGSWESLDSYLLADELVDPVPLVEMPEREELRKAVTQAMGGWHTNVYDVVESVLELLRGER